MPCLRHYWINWKPITILAVNKRDGDESTMTCEDFERTWQDLLDADICGAGRTHATSAPVARTEGQADSFEPPRDRSLREHAAVCPACQQKSARYRALQHALASWGPPPPPSANLASRILAELDAPAASVLPIKSMMRPRLRWPLAATIAASAAAILIAFGLNHAYDPWRSGRSQTALLVTPAGVDNHTRGPSPDGATAGARSLNHALAEATEATWELARSASEPAARIGRQVLDAATSNDASRPAVATSSASRESMVSVPSLGALAPDTAAAGALLQQVGDRLATGVRPLSETARHAFGFLLGPALPKPEVITNQPPSQKGA